MDLKVVGNCLGPVQYHISPFLRSWCRRILILQLSGFLAPTVGIRVGVFGFSFFLYWVFPQHLEIILDYSLTPMAN